MERKQDERQLTMLSRFGGESRSGTPSTDEPVKRAQKNLSLNERDIERMSRLAKRDGVSQARLVAMALDAYESLHGRLET